MSMNPFFAASFLIIIRNFVFIPQIYTITAIYIYYICIATGTAGAAVDLMLAIYRIVPIHFAILLSLSSSAVSSLLCLLSQQRGLWRRRRRRLTTPLSICVSMAYVNVVPRHTSTPVLNHCVRRMYKLCASENIISQLEIACG